MSLDETPSAEDPLIAVLVAWDRVLAGETTVAPDTGDLPAELRPRLERDLACLRRLRAALSAGQAPAVAAAEHLGRFEILRQLGRGAHGVVFLAHDPHLGRDVALKVPRPEALATPELRERFLREARAAAGLNHPNLVPVYEAGAAGPVCFIASAYCPGPTLGEWLKQRAEPVPPLRAADLITTLAEGIHHAHERGVVHRDLKPSNILLQRKSESSNPKSETKAEGPGSNFGVDDSDLEPKVADFGLAKLVDEEAELTQTGVILGTPCYMAPEQATGRSRDVSAAVDQYALGAILYELLTGRPPFRGATPLETIEQVRTQEPLAPSRLAPSCPRDLETICLVCLRKEPQKRYASARALAEDLRRFATGRPILARPNGAGERAWKWARRRPALAALIVVSVVAVAGLLAGALWHNGRLQAERDYALHQERLAREGESDAREQRRIADRERGRAEERTRTSRRLLYAANLNRAQHEWEAGRIGWVLALLEGERPKGGEEDLRGFEWHYLWRLCHGERFCLSGGRTPLAGAVAPHLAADGAEGRPAVSPDGRTVAIADGAVVRLWDLTTGRVRATLSGHQHEIRGLAFSGDGKTLASAAGDGPARLWNVDSGKARTTLAFPPGSVLGMALSADGRWLATTGSDAGIALWEVATRKRRTFFRAGARGSARLLVFAPDARTLAVVGREDPNEAQLWDVPAGTRRAVLRGHTEEVTAIVFSPDSKTVLTRSEDRTGRVWDAVTGRARMTVRDADDGWVTCMAFAADGRTFATGVGHPFNKLKAGGVTVWDTASLEQRAAWEATAGGAWALAFAPDGDTLAEGVDVGSIHLRDLPAGQLRGTLHGHRDRVHFLSFAPAGRTLISMSLADETVRLWEPTPRPQPVILRGHSGAATGVAFAPDGWCWASCGADGVVRVRDTITGQQQFAVTGPGGAVNAVAFSPNGRILAAASQSGTVKLWDRVAGKDHLMRSRPMGTLRSLCFSPDGRLLAAAGGEPGEVRLWDAATGTERGRWAGNAPKVWSVAFSADGRLLAWADGFTVRVWDLAAGSERFHRKTEGNLMSVAFGPARTAGERLLATGGWGCPIRLWDLDTGKEQAVLKGHAGPILCVTFAPDGKVLASASHDGTVKLWDLATGQLRFTLTGRRAMLESVAFSPDGLTLVAALKDGYVELWDAAGEHAEGPRGGTAMRLGRQIEAVSARLRQLNPGFDGFLGPSVEGGVVTGLNLSADNITDLSPLRQLPGLKRLRCEGSAPGKGKLADLSPLRGLPLTELSFAQTRVADLSPLRGMPLRRLIFTYTPVADLSLLKGLPLRILDCAWSPVSDLSPLKGMRLEALYITGNRVSDLMPLRGMPLTELCMGQLPVKDLAPLRGMRLVTLYCFETPVSDLSPLRGMPLTTLVCYAMPKADLSPLRGLPLKDLRCDIRSERDLEVLRSLKGLEWIAGQRAAAFWKARLRKPLGKP